MFIDFKPTHRLSSSGSDGGGGGVQVGVLLEGGGRSRNTRREPSTMGKQLVSFITCGCESSAPFCNLQSRAGIAFEIKD